MNDYRTHEDEHLVLEHIRDMAKECYGTTVKTAIAIGPSPLHMLHIFPADQSTKGRYLGDIEIWIIRGIVHINMTPFTQELKLANEILRKENYSYALCDPDSLNKIRAELSKFKPFL